MKPATTVTAAFALGIVAALPLYFAPALTAKPVTGAPSHPVWSETKWPFLMDQWGEGKAFRCGAADCGADVAFYIRPKIGFCSSTTGVADDSELERLSDFDLVKGTVAALGQGRDIEVAGMKGRLRAYSIAGRGQSMISVAYNSNSDALVATVVMDGVQPDLLEPAVLTFLNGKPMQRWVSLALGQ